MSLSLVFLLVGSLKAGEPDAWWVICGHCKTDSDFRLAAYQAPLDGLVFVTGSGTDASRKFELVTTVEDSPGETIVVATISDLAISPSHVSVLAESLDRANTIAVALDREDFSIGEQRHTPVSVIEDTQFGQVIAGFRHSLFSHLLSQGMFPTPSSVAAELSINVRGISIGGSVVDELRTVPIRVEVRYPDGSRLAFTIAPDAVRISEVAMYDAQGHELPSLVNASNLIEFDRAGFSGRAFEFGHAPTAFMDWLNHGGSGAAGEPFCRVEPTEDRVSVICRQPS
ncbi:MAG: hypothetical protein ACXIUM_05970 [Wenzhouxiangella sp.]